MDESILNIEDMEVVLDEGPPNVIIDVIEDASLLEDDIFNDFLNVQETETPAIETKIELPAGTSENDEVAIVYNLEGNAIQSFDSRQDVNTTHAYTECTLQRKTAKLSNDDDDRTVEEHRSKPLGKIPLALRGLIGQAKMFMLQRNFNMAITICVNILKECPNASEPFFTLSDIYEQMGDMKKSLETAVIGNSLSSVTSEDWLLLGETCESNNMLQLTEFCLKKAIRKDNRNLDLYIKRASILEQLGTVKSAMYEYDRLLRRLRPDQKDSIITLSKLLVDSFVKNNNYDRAANVLIHVFGLYPNNIEPEEFVTCLDYLIKTKNYRKCLGLLVEHYNLEFVADVNDSSPEIVEIIECVAPNTMPILVRVKLIELLIQLKTFSILPTIYEPVLNMTEVNQFHLVIANVLFESNQHKHAILFFEKLMNCEKQIFDQHILKIKYSECLNILGHLEQAVDSYKKLLEINPEQLTIKFDLYMTLKKLNRIDESLELLFQDNIKNRDCRLNYEYVLASLHKDDLFEECLKAAKLVFSRHCIPVSSLREVNTMIALRYSAEGRYNAVLTMKKEVCDYQQETTLISNPLPSVEEEWDLMKNICLKCIEKNLYHEGLKMLLSAMNSVVLAPYFHTIILNAIKFAYKIRAYKLGFVLSRYLLFKYPQAPQVSNIFFYFFKKCPEAKKQAKFIFRLAAKYPDNFSLNLLDTNLFYDTYNYQLIFSRYTELLDKLEDKSLLYFVLGVIVLRLCTFKVGTDRHCLALQGIGFLMKYKEHRGVEHEQECYFNIARAYHEVGMVAKSLHYYKLVLETEPSNKDDCLKYAAAYNLHLIYLDSGNVDVALMYISQVKV